MTWLAYYGLSLTDLTGLLVPTVLKIPSVQLDRNMHKKAVKDLQQLTLGSDVDERERQCKRSTLIELCS